jgi:hypothetical protein
LLAALVLARLDTIFIAGALLVWLVSIEIKDGRLNTAWRSVVGFVSLTLVYVLFNRAYAGTFLPVSGAAKTSFPHIDTENASMVVASANNFLGDVAAFFRLWRLGQMFVPALFALLTIPLLVRRDAGRLEQFLAVSGTGVIALSAYNFCFVEDWQQGHWYYAVSIFWMSLTLIALLQRLRFPWLVRSETALGFAAALDTAIFFGLFRQPECHREQAAFLDRASVVRAHYPERTKLFEYDDGIIAFATGFPTMNGMGLAVDYDAAKEARIGGLGAVAYDRGFDRAAVLSYSPFDFTKANPEQIATFISTFTPLLNLGPGFELTLEFALERTRFAIFRIRRRAP